MQRDIKVGLSLGVLVLGVVGALLFRKEQISDSPKPTLKAAREYDERIAEGRLTPYMIGDLEFDQEEADNASDKPSQTAGRPAHAVPPDWMRDDEDPFEVARKPNGQFDFQKSAHAGEPTVKPLQPRSHASGTESHPVAQTEQRTHVIQAGDSLSLLAERYLGNQGRFQEIYDANREVLPDVNRLPLGKTLVIPDSAKPAPKVASGTPNVARPGANALEKARGKITDVSTIEPVGPPEDAHPFVPSETTAKADRTGAEPELPAKTQEARKFVAPTRLPFANQQNVKSGQSVRKALDPEGEDFVPSKTPADKLQADTSTDTKRYVVRKGDSLERISTRVYGNAKRAGDIYAANRELLSSPNAVREGQELVLPD